MPKFTSQVKSEESVERVNNLIASYLYAQGYKLSNKKKGNEWRKGFYWFKFVRYTYTQGIINLEVWNFCPYPGLGSFLMYFIGIEEIKTLLKDLEHLFNSGAPLAVDTMNTQNETSSNQAQTVQPQAVPTLQKKTVGGFAKAWLIFWIVGNMAAVLAPVNMLSNSRLAGVVFLVMLLSAVTATGYYLLYHKNHIGLYMILIANFLGVFMNNTQVSGYSINVTTGLIIGIITFFVTRKQVAYPFLKSPVTK